LAAGANPLLIGGGAAALAIASVIGASFVHRSRKLTAE
jgi:hypothetical protein